MQLITMMNCSLLVRDQYDLTWSENWTEAKSILLTHIYMAVRFSGMAQTLNKWRS